MNLLSEIKLAYAKASVAEKIIYVTIFFYLCTALFTSFMVDWFALPSQLSEVISKPWTIISYVFIHDRLIHVLSNLIVLYYIGNLFLDFYSEKTFINFYFLGTLFGGIAFLLVYYLTDKIGIPLGGASAAVTAIFVGIATKLPRYAIQLRLIGSVQLWVLAAIWVGLSLIQLTNQNNGGAIAHTAGALFGFIYVKQLEKGNDIGKWFEYFVDYFLNFTSKSKKSPLKTVHRSHKKSDKEEVSKTKQRKINDILDKISKSGYESLSQEEKDFLFRSGK
ncbi:rhomboid family intramembrane serine protease [Lutibacter sp.]|uniref:rhomboid family intramembrane serine protease n=1 Tax=Lutibacter sp. TaxID=1925666 RepID=UPI0027367D41|nr:rhomboid family intramembrane serine protease [Lutibacter sp.]MDP3313088.1 rhomboid family intramembrane serine protease [Lutibacter sp.]